MEGTPLGRERREDAARWLGAVCLVLLCAATLWRAPLAVSRLGTLAGQSSRLDYADREIAGGNGIIIDQAAAYAARQIIPPHADYRVVVGPGLKDATSLSETFAPLYYGYFLMPRHQSPTARWIICFGCDLRTTGAREIWRDEDGIAIAEVPA